MLSTEVDAVSLVERQHACVGSVARTRQLLSRIRMELRSGVWFWGGDPAATHAFDLIGIKPRVRRLFRHTSRSLQTLLLYKLESRF